MDECRFDNWTRMLGALRDRRAALKGLTAAAAALVSLARADLGFAAEDDVLVEGCRLSGEKCSKNKNCCSNLCSGRGRKKKRRKNRRDEDGNRNRRRDRRREGECKCRGNGSNCRKDAACCRGFCDKNDGRCRCVPSNDTCNKDSDCCRGECRADNQGNRFCKAG
jgi:hypothetical protein